MGRHAEGVRSTVSRRLVIPVLTVVLLAGASALAVASALPGGAPAPIPLPSPCVVTAKACAQLSTDEAWLTDGKGNIIRGPVRMTHGGPGEETPTGSFSVVSKDATHVSSEEPGVKMPWSVFFDDHGRAFHGGSLAKQSAGCVHLDDGDAESFFDHLQVGDPVQIIP